MTLALAPSPVETPRPSCFDDPRRAWSFRVKNLRISETIDVDGVLVGRPEERSFVVFRDGGCYLFNSTTTHQLRVDYLIGAVVRWLVDAEDDTDDDF